MKIIVLIIISLSIYFAYAIYQDDRDWEQFKKQHHCTVTSYEQGSINTGLGLTASGHVGTITTSTPDKTGYLCDDRITYYRDN